MTAPNFSTPIDQVEAAIVTAVEAAATGLPLDVDTLPARFSVAELEQRLHPSPGVYVCHQGGDAIPENVAAIDAEFGVYFALKNARGEKARRVGDPNKAGAYQLMTLIVPALQNLFVEGIGSLTLRRTENLFGEDLDRKGISLYAAIFTIPIAFPIPDPARVAEFLTYYRDIITPPLTDQTPPMAPNSGQLATDDVSLQGDGA